MSKLYRVHYRIVISSHVTVSADDPNRAADRAIVEANELKFSQVSESYPEIVHIEPVHQVMKDCP